MNNAFIEWLDLYQLNVIITAVIFVIYLVFRYLVGPIIRRKAEHGRLKDSATSKALAAVNILLIIGAVASSMVVWGFDFRGLLTLSASIVAVTGVALFAGWSLLSNITAFFLLLAHSSFRRGNFIRILDADNYIEGYISEINLFNTKLISEGREVIIYPNNLIMSRPSIVNPRNRLDTAGKLTAPVPKNQTVSAAKTAEETKH